MPRNNPEGRNQHGNVAPASEELAAILQSYCNRGIISYAKIRQKLNWDHPGKYPMGRSIFYQRMKELNIITPRTSEKRGDLTAEELHDAIVAEIHEDANQRRGPAYIQERLQRRGIHPPVNVVRTVMKLVAPDGFLRRHPHMGQGKDRIVREKVICLGPGEKISVDGHEKLLDIGYAVYGFRDAWGKILAYWVVPNARLACVPSYLYLKVVRKLKAIPIQITSDRGSETVELYALQRSLRATFDPELDQERVPAYVYLPSTRNIIIERSWRPFVEKLGRNIQHRWANGRLEAGFLENNDTHRALADWIWAPLVQKEVDDYVDQFNDHHVRYQPEKVGPSGCSMNYAFENPAEFNGTNNYVPIDPLIIDDLMVGHDGAEA
ncbi:hypothetical protein FS837_004469, partial [Tulasnella sp. UAMH 9824]